MTTTAAASEPLSWLGGAERGGIAAVSHSSTFRAGFLARDVRGFAAKSAKDVGDAVKESAGPILPREGAEDAQPQVQSSPTSLSSSGASRTAVAELAAVFTCNVCDLRSAKGFSRVAFERGVVIVTCEGCESMHVLADRLGWFGGPGDAADFLRERRGGDGGEGAGQVRARAVVSKPSGGGRSGSDSARTGVLELMPEDLEGWSRSRKKKKGRGDGAKN